jgi:hypothetical protein
MAASREASKLAGDPSGVVGLSTLAIAFSTRSIRDLSLRSHCSAFSARRREVIVFMAGHESKAQ